MNKVTTSPSKKICFLSAFRYSQNCLPSYCCRFCFQRRSCLPDCHHAAKGEHENIFFSPGLDVPAMTFPSIRIFCIKENLICSGSMRRMRNRLPNTETSETFEREWYPSIILQKTKAFRNNCPIFTPPWTKGCSVWSPRFNKAKTSGLSWTGTFPLKK